MGDETPRRLSQIFDPLSRLTELTSRSTPSSPRLLPRRAREPMAGAQVPVCTGVLTPPLTMSALDGLDLNAAHCSTASRGEPVNWQERCLELQLELHRTKAQATRARDMLRDKLSELEQRVLEAEGRAEEAEDKVRIMEQRLARAGADSDISRLEGAVEEQRQLRLQDARQVEAKAARIKEWVTNKLRELEQQNQTLREQNIKCNQQLELLKNHLALADRRRSESASPQLSDTKHRRHQSVCTPQPVMDTLGEELKAAVAGLSILPPPPSVSDPDLSHDYAEIYTPSREKVSWPRPPTPPLHRFPSWEDRIYQVAADGLTLTGHAAPEQGPEQAGYQEISVPVYATVKGRASQIRSMPFTGDSSDDSSDGEGGGATTVDGGHSRSSGDTSGSSPGKRTASSSSGSPSKSKTRDTSFESGMSDDYAIPPDALSCDTTSLESSLLLRSSYLDSPNKRNESLEKCGSLAKLGGKLKTWRKRWFVLKGGVLSYWKSQDSSTRKPQGQIVLDDMCRITRADGAATFEIDTGKKTYYLTADSIAAMEEWIRVLQNVQRRNATKLLLSKEEHKPAVQGWLTKVKNGHAKKCWCVLIGKMFLYFKSPTDSQPAGQINMRDARVEEVEHLSDSDSEERETESPDLTVGIFPTHQGPTYLLCPSKQERDAWLYHLTVASGGGPSAGTQYEQLVHRLMEVDGDANCVLWRHPVLLHSKECIVAPLTTLCTEALQAEAVKLFKCCQLFMSVAVEQAGIDYHVVLAQNALQQCLDAPELQGELLCALVKQTSRGSPHPRLGVQVSNIKLKSARLLLCATQSLFTCEVSTTPDSKPTDRPVSSQATDSKGPPPYALLQGWQLLALAVSLFTPRSSRLLWFLKLHISRHSDTRTECGKYAAYCERALERTIQTGPREVKPSRMEVLSILLKNPHHHSRPHSMPVHLLNGAYHIAGFDGSSTVREFQETLAHELGCRVNNGFTLFSDDPIERDLEHCLDPSSKLCDVISRWETALREKGSGKFENSRVIRVTYKCRLWWRGAAETERERLLLCYQVNKQIVAGRFPLSRELALELAALMAQLDLGDCGNNALSAVDRFYPYRYRDQLTPEGLNEIQERLMEKWRSLRSRTQQDCVRIYLTCTRKWPFFGAALFQARLRQVDQPMIWLAVSEDSVTLLELASMAVRIRYPYSSVLTFGGCQDDFMLVVCGESGGPSQKLLFSLSKPRILELTLLMADYMNALGQHPGTPQLSTLGRPSAANAQPPDILKSTPDHTRTDSKRRTHVDSGLA